MIFYDRTSAVMQSSYNQKKRCVNCHLLQLEDGIVLLVAVPKQARALEGGASHATSECLQRGGAGGLVVAGNAAQLRVLQPALPRLRLFPRQHRQLPPQRQDWLLQGATLSTFEPCKGDVATVFTSSMSYCHSCYDEFRHGTPYTSGDHP